MYTAEQILTQQLRGQRVLAAIVFTDVVGFSALMAADEEHTLDLIRRDFRIMKQLCQRFEGKVIKTIGDAILMYFNSAVQAVACAQEIQSNLAELATNATEQDVLIHRIGIHLGDVFFNGKDVMGDGVNIAARLQAESEPGGICISQTVYDVVKKPLGLKSTNLVPKRLKNIPESVLIYRIPPVSLTEIKNQWEPESAQIKPEDSADKPDLSVNSSGHWVLLHEHFFEIETYCQNPDGTLTIQIPSQSIQDDAAIQSLTSESEQSQPIKFAYGDEGFFVKVIGIRESSTEDCHIWKVTLQPHIIRYDGQAEESYQGAKYSFSADEIAQLKGRRLLLNDPPKLLSDARLFSAASAKREIIEKLIQGTGQPVSLEDCVLHSLYPKYKGRGRLFLELARLEAIFLLKVSGVIEQVLELSFTQINPEQVRVKFRGKRRHVYVDIEPALIEIDGDCSLVTEN